MQKPGFLQNRPTDGLGPPILPPETQQNQIEHALGWDLKPRPRLPQANLAMHRVSQEAEFQEIPPQPYA